MVYYIVRYATPGLAKSQKIQIQQGLVLKAIVRPVYAKKCI